MFTNNPLADFHRFDAECEDRLERRPICECCKEHIQDDGAYETDDGLICEECMDGKISEWKNDHYQHID